MTTGINNEILSGLNETTANLLEVIAQFDPKQFNNIPFEDSWTAGQVAEHILKSESGIPTILKGNNKPTLRQPDQHVQQIKNTFLDFTTKMKSPEFILPTEEIKDKLELYESLKQNRLTIIALAASTDLSKTFYDFTFPGIGELTGIEWLTFIICHSKRHTHQLKNIYAALN